MQKIHITLCLLPATISRFHLPGGPGVRIDTHAYGDYKVPSNYDSMVGKLITYGESERSGTC
jgi:acetyl-CoA carboxylase biotin carboxylase subunit